VDAVGYSKLDLGTFVTGQSDFSQAVLHISSTGRKRDRGRNWQKQLSSHF